jgi:hypothetical protein
MDGDSTAVRGGTTVLSRYQLKEYPDPMGEFWLFSFRSLQRFEGPPGRGSLVSSIYSDMS